jgi:DNA-binding NarL/FixJ family response regulator
MITVLLAAETQLLRQLLGDALNDRFGLAVSATASTAARALALCDNLSVDVVVVCMRMPDAAALVRALLDRLVRVVTLGACADDPVAVITDGTLHDVVAAIHGAMHGAFSRTSAAARELVQLTPTERSVLQAVNDGRSNKEIARELGVAVPTVKHHVHNLLTKLGVRRRGEAAALLRGAAAYPPPPARPGGVLTR